ncbi:kazal-type serine protease inhibitor domain-containing protein 1-like [Scleropages formosus]|uniref:Kazal-type serine protease inhibitor domain-containing protein 1-like n=1 Tax=Scleropages formosus TaxID=113540 RepID=A0A0P7YC74_SCLFO|nr:kazal-type serine protease inhibitor domain-containing protein 1-like [Scleropages formosus]
MEIVALLLALSLLPWSDTLPARRYRPRDRRVSCPGEGRLCDPDAYFGTFFGRCGEGLSCRAGPRDPFSDEIPKPRCVCNRQELLCGSDHKTYENMCQFRAARFRLRDRGRLTVTHFGPCRAKPVIVGPPGDVTGKEGSDVVFSCKVLSYPMAVIEWRKEGNGIFLPADDTNMMVEAHGGPRRFELTGWLQIQNIQRADQGTYTCAARSPFGEVSASAKLCVLDKEVQPPRPPPQNTGIYDVPDDEDYESLSSGLSY